MEQWKEIKNKTFNNKYEEDVTDIERTVIDKKNTSNIKVILTPFLL
jgi:hypothetical protein